jgi:CHAT domain-containing protein
MSLWKVDDRATQDLMELFYSSWTKSGDALTAFASAQKAMLKKYKEPYYWGAFVLMNN